MKPTRVLFAVCGVFLLLAALPGCNSGGDGDGTGEGETRVTRSATAIVDRVLDVVIGEDTGVSRGLTPSIDPESRIPGGASARQEDVSVTIPCNTGQVSFDGEATVEEAGTVDRFTINGSVTFANCDGINGALTLNSTGTVDSRQIVLSVTLNSSVSAEGCNITFNAFRANTTATLSGSITAPILATGSLSATCGGESIACTLNNIDINNQEAFEGSCQST